LDGIQEGEREAKWELLSSLGCIAVFIMWIRVFYWLRLFPEIARFLRLIEETIKDMKAFAILFLIILLAFGNVFYIASLDRQNSDVAFFDGHTDVHPLDAIIQ